LTNQGPEVNIINAILSSVPIFILVFGILVIKWTAPKAAAVAWIVAVIIALVSFGADITIIAIGSSKGLSLSVFILSILFSSVLLYNVIDRLGGIDVIGQHMTNLVGGSLSQSLVVGWAFSGFMQGVAGFGVPVAVVTPLMMFMGFKPVKATAIVLVGHAWAVSFGSLGSSFYTLTLVTGLPADELAHIKALLTTLPILLSGVAVAHIEGGMSSVKKGASTILLMGIAMALTNWGFSYIGAPQIASIASGLVGAGTGWILINLGLLGKEITKPSSDMHKTKPRHNFHLMFLPYYLVVFLSFLSQTPWIKDISATWYWGLNYPEIETALGFVSAQQENYAKIRMLRHPAPLLLSALALSCFIYMIMGLWTRGTMLYSLKRTYNQSLSSAIGVGAMIMMAIVMTDVGMTTTLGRAMAQSTNMVFPILSPFMGMLGTFLTGSNTSSNIMFASLQVETASALGIDKLIIAATQSVSGGIGSSIAPAKVLVGTALVGLSGSENKVLRKTMPYCLAILVILGIQAWIITYVLKG